MQPHVTFQLQVRPRGTSLPVLHRRFCRQYLRAGTRRWNAGAEFLHNVTVPTDPQSGQPSGRARTNRSFSPWRWTKPFRCCQRAGLRWNAAESGAALVAYLVEGKQEHYFTTRLTDATIVAWTCTCRTARTLHSVSLRNCRSITGIP